MRGENKMKSEEYTKIKESFDITGICSHLWIKSNPFKTYEGEFVITNCIICHDAWVEYEKQIIHDKMGSLVGFLANKGMRAQEKMSVLEDPTMKLLLKDNSVEDDYSDLFEKIIV